MSSNSNGSATFLMFLVLAAMAAVGVFGLPQFPPPTASSDSENNDEFPDDFASFEPSRSGESMAQGVEDLFASVETPHDERFSPDNDAFPSIETDRAGDAALKGPGIVDLLVAAEAKPELPSQSASNDTPAGRRSLDSEFQSPPFDDEPSSRHLPRQQPAPRGTALDSRFGRRSNADAKPTSFGRGAQAEPASGTDGRGSRPSMRSAVGNGNPSVVRVADAGRGTAAVDAAADKPLTWRSAGARLRTLGITHYRLSPGTAPNEFHFSCFFSPGGDPRITQRFEAEATEPLGAVEKVLAEVDSWRSQHSGDRSNRMAAGLLGPAEGNAVADSSNDLQ